MLISSPSVGCSHFVGGGGCVVAVGGGGGGGWGWGWGWWRPWPQW